MLARYIYPAYHQQDLTAPLSHLTVILIRGQTVSKGRLPVGAVRNIYTCCGAILSSCTLKQTVQTASTSILQLFSCSDYQPQTWTARKAWRLLSLSLCPVSLVGKLILVLEMTVTTRKLAGSRNCRQHWHRSWTPCRPLYRVSKTFLKKRRYGGVTWC